MKRTLTLVGLLLPFWISPLAAQDLGPHFLKLKDGIYVYARDANSNCGIIITQEGVALIDSGPNPPDSLIILKAIKKLTSQPIRFLINTETHNDHTTGNFVFSPPAIVIAAVGATEGIKSYYSAARNQKLMNSSPEMRDAFKGFRLVTPHIEYRDHMVLYMGDRTLELLQLQNIHSDADTAIWLPKERVLFSAAVAAVKRFGFLRPFVTIDHIKSDIQKLKALNPEIVVPAHGLPGTVQWLDETDRFYDVLLERVGKMVGEGKSLDDIKKELRLPEEYQGWSGGKERLDTNVEAAYRAVKK